MDIITFLRSPPFICVTNDHGYVPFVVITTRPFLHAWLITGFVTRVTRRVHHMEHELCTLSEHLVSPPLLTCVSGVRVVKLHVFTFLVRCCDVRYDFRVKRCLILLDSHLLCRGFMYIYVFCIYLCVLDFHIRWCSCGLTETRRVEQKLLILPVHMSSLPVFLSGVRVFLSLVFHVMFYRSLFVLWCFFFWPLCCSSFFNLRFLISPLVSSNPLFLVSSNPLSRKSG